MIRLTIIYIVLSFLMLTACEDPLLRARRVMQEDPKQAIELIKEAAQDEKSCDQCPLYLAMAYEKLNNIPSAIQSLKSATGSKNQNIANNALAELYNLYRNNFIKSSDTQKRFTLAQEAQKLERKLKIADGFGGGFLLKFYKNQFKKEMKNHKLKKAIQSLKNILATFAPASRKKNIIKDANRQLRAYFIKEFSARLPQIKADLSKTKYFDHKTSEILISNRFIVPSKTVDPMFDPIRHDFPLRVRVKACGPLIRQLMAVVQVFYTNSPVELKPMNKKNADYLFRMVFPITQTGYDVLNPQNKKKAGLPYLCKISIKPVDFVNYLYFLWNL